MKGRPLRAATSFSTATRIGWTRLDEGPPTQGRQRSPGFTTGTPLFLTR